MFLNSVYFEEPVSVDGKQFKRCKVALEKRVSRSPKPKLQLSDVPLRRQPLLLFQNTFWLFFQKYPKHIQAKTCLHLSSD